MSALSIAVAMYIAYLVGSLSTAIIVCRVMGLPDPRTQGSNNPGATNVLRIGGKKAAVITLIGDFLKGLLPVVVARWYGFDMTALALISLAAFLGHLFPIYYKFEGGKGVATYIGCLFGLNWIVGLGWVAAWAIVTTISRYVSLGSIIASLLAPLYIWLFTRNWNVVAVLSVMTLLIIIRHRGNIAKLAHGVENKIGQKKI